MNPEWVQELKRIAFKVVDYLSGSVVLSIQVLMGNNGIFYVKSINQLPLVQQQFGSAIARKRLSRYHRTSSRQDFQWNTKRTYGRNDSSSDL